PIRARGNISWAERTEKSMEKPFAPSRILAGTDFSDLSTWALRHAAMWAQRYRAHLTVLHVQELPLLLGDPYFGVYDIAQMVEEAREATLKELTEYARQYVPSEVPVDCAVVPGTPASVIEEWVASSQIDLVV